MGKIKIQYELINTIDNTKKTNELLGISINNDIIYIDDAKTKITIDNNILIIRENEDYLIKLNLINKKETKGIYYLKKYNKYLNMNIYTDDIDTSNGLTVKYNVYFDKELTGKFIYRLKYKKSIDTF